MGYIGPGLDFGAFQKIDDISSGFNGSQQSLIFKLVDRQPRLQVLTN